MRSNPKLRLVTEQNQEAADFDAVNVEEAGLSRRDGSSIVIPFHMIATEWVRRLRAAGAITDLVALSLVLQDMARRAASFPVTGAVMLQAGVARQHKRQLLQRLVELNLIQVEWRGRKSPWVTPFFRPGRTKVSPSLVTPSCHQVW
jgi:hypothetical protein